MLLTACETPTLDIRQELLTTLKAQPNFAVEESFEWKRFATLNNAPWNELVEINNTIEFENNRYFVEHRKDEETNTNRMIERTLFEAASYKSIYSRNAAILVERQWYHLDLPLINAIGLGSLDPVYVVTELLFNNKELYYKSDAGVTGDISSYRIAVVTISDVLFNDMFEHSVASYVDFPYPFTVTAELRFNDAYEITNIDFDLNRLIRQYRDYFSVQQGAVFNSLSGTYSLVYRDYGGIRVNEPTTRTTFQPTTELLTVFDQAVVQSTLLSPVFTTTIDSATGQRVLQTTIVFERAGRIAVIEVLGMVRGQIVYNGQQQVVPIRTNQSLQLQPIPNVNQLDQMYVTIRFLDQKTSSVIFETLNATSLLNAHYSN